MLNAILMPYVLKANYPVIKNRLHGLRAIWIWRPILMHFLDWVLSMREDIGIHHALSEIIPEESRLSAIGEMAVVDPSAGTNPILHDAAAYTKIVRSAYNAEL